MRTARLRSVLRRLFSAVRCWREPGLVGQYEGLDAVAEAGRTARRDTRYFSAAGLLALALPTRKALRSRAIEAVGAAE